MSTRAGRWITSREAWEPSRSGRERTAERRAQRRSSRNKLLLAFALLVAFAIGVALGQALHDNPRPGGVQTSIRTLPPLTETHP
jgi:hypothetical protein